MSNTANIRMPMIIYGTAWKAERTVALVEQALALGFRGIDTACQPKHYHEAGVGQGIAASMTQGLKRADLFIQSKFTPVDGQDPLRLPYDPKASLSEQVAQSFQKSLLNLGTDYLDSLLLHSPLNHRPDFIRVWRAMETLVVAGGVKQLGISNCYDLATLSFLYEQAEIKPTIVQNRFYCNTGYDRNLRSFCLQHHLFYQSFWTLTANSHILENPRLLGLAKQYSRSPAQIFFRYLSQRGIVPLSGTSSTQHMQEDIAIADFALTTDDTNLLDRLLH